MKLFFLLLIPLVGFAQNECRIEKKLNAPSVKCRDRSGYLDFSEKVSLAVIEYRINGQDSRIELNDISALDLISDSQIKEHLIKAGISNPAQIKVSKVSIAPETPLYKDAETKVLSSGCHYTYAPTILSYGKGESCGDFICNSQVECKKGKISKRSDAFCRALIVKEGASCPTAFECLSDNSIIIEKYVPSSGGRHGNHSSGGKSGGTKQ